MLSHTHETLLAMFRHRPGLAAELLAAQLGIPLPVHADARITAAEVTELSPTEHRADAVIVLHDHDHPVLAVVVEIQLRRDDTKPWIWPVYITGVRRRVRCPTLLLVLCTDAVTARWAAPPIDLGGGSVLHPHVLGPDSVPVLTDPTAAARTPELAVLSALTHVEDDGPYAVLDALVTALDHVEVDHAVEYAHLVLAALPHLARVHMEELMATETYEYESEFTRRLHARGRVEGRVEGQIEGRVVMLLRLLQHRGVDVPTDALDHIRSCTDLDQLEAWGDRALTADTISDVLR